MKIIMDGKEVVAERGQTIVEVARRNGIFIPTLCHLPGLEPAGMCRICTVELTERGRTRKVTACNYPLRSDVEIKTDTPDLRHGRKMIIELLYARCPDSQILKDLAQRYGADLDRFSVDNKDCIMCGLCARVCERVGSNALSLSGRGAGITVDSPFHKLSKTCIACGACALVCPVHKIEVRDEAGERKVMVKGFEVSRTLLRKCTSCGEYFGPVIDLTAVLERAGESQVPPFNANICPTCSRRNLAARLAQRHFEQYALEPNQADEEDFSA